MGIPVYFSKIMQEHKNCIETVVPPSCFEWLLMDCNSIIYDIIHEPVSQKTTVVEDERKRETVVEDGRNERKRETVVEDGRNERKRETVVEDEATELTVIIIEKCIQKIKEYIVLFAPTKGVFIAFDGVAPIAKMKQQKKRRHQSTWLKQQGLGDSAKFDTNTITPGTPFMDQLAESILSANFLSGTKIECVVSSSHDVGEGEHKMFHFIKTKSASSVLVYGLDADLIMLSLFNLSFVPTVYIAREAPQWATTLLPKTEAVQRTVAVPSSNMIYLNVGELGNQIELIGFSLPDYMFLCFFLGNDFLPSFPSFSLRHDGMERFVECYLRLKRADAGFCFIRKNKIQWEFVHAWAQECAKQEHSALLSFWAMRENQEKRASLYGAVPPSKQIENIPVIFREMEKYICPSEEGWEARYYRAFEIRDVPKMCQNYWQGIEWVFCYYTNWQSPITQSSWKYNYGHPPLWSDLVSHPRQKCRFPSRTAISEKEIPNFVNPPQGVLLKPQFDWTFCRYFWESHLKENHGGVAAPTGAAPADPLNTAPM
jgi:5'-3' exonuclease